MQNSPPLPDKAGGASRKWRCLTMLSVLVIASWMAAPLACAERPWLSPNYRDHPLAGTVWTADFKPVTAQQLETAAAQANFVLLGEIHNNADHHRLQAQMIEALVRAGRRPAVVFEMIPASLQAGLDRHLQSSPADAAGLGKFLNWEERGWPDWAIYQPVAEAALAAKLPLRGGALDRDTSRAIGKSDPSQAKLILDLGLDQPVRPEAVAGLAREIEDGHCNMLPKSAVKPMIMVQRAVDAQLAKILLGATPKDGAVLIAGSGHARKDWAVPTFIKQKLPDASVISIAFFEVDPERPAAADYVDPIAGLGAPYDFIYFTPKADLVDRCAEMAEQMGKIRPKP
ncbi:MULTISPECIES: ChaN family lipoprotein [Rhodomicrobium]|uniref:ChaN family lipoprotein n=1 Tax=Rhodomicrobium TaxID=1068 RepID=UPI000B4BE860|nr:MULTISPECIES: ChaN family lipoprotein [Rhodomicrobium]